MKLNYHYLLAIDIIILCLMYLSSIGMQIVLFTISILFKVIDFDIYNPRCCFSSIFYLYSISYPLLYLFNLLDYEYGCSFSLIPTQFLGLIAFNFALGEAKVKNSIKGYTVLSPNFLVLRCIMMIGIILIILSCVLLMKGGYSNKHSIYNGGNDFIIFCLSYVYLHIFFTFYYWIAKDKCDIFCFFALIIPIVQGLISGERDVSFHIFIMIALLLYSKGIFKKKYILTCIPIVFLLIPLSAVFKYYLLSTTQSDTEMFTSGRIFLHDFFYAEFIAASRNLQLLIEKTSNDTYTILDLPLSILSRFVPSDYVSPISYFNDHFFYGSNTGHGFTIVGEGLLYAGNFGIIIVMILLGIIAQKLYANSLLNKYSKTLYLFFIPLFLYSCRGELSTVIVPLIKYGLVSYFCIKLISISNK